MSAVQHLENMMYEFLRTRLTDREKLELSCGYDVEKHIDEESEDEMRYDVYNLVKNMIRWRSVIERLQHEADDSDDEEAKSDDDVEYDSE